MQVERATAGSIAWGELLLASVAALSAMGAMLNFAPLLPMVELELGLSHTWSGALVSTGLLAHTLLQLPGGQIADALGVKRTLVLAQSLLGASLLASALATGLASLLLFRFVTGIGTALSFVSGLSFVNSLVPPNRRSVAQGMYGAAGNLGVLLVLLISDPLARVGGWRGVFVVEGLLVLAVASISMARLRPGGVHPRAASVSWQDVLRRRPLYLLGLANTLTYGVFMGIAAWAATFFWQTHGIDLGLAGLLAAFMAAGAMLGRSIGGILSMGRERQAILVSCLAAAVCTLLVPLLPGAAPALLALLLLGWFASMPFGAIFSYTSFVSDASSIGRSFGVVTFVSNLGAFGFPTAIGYALDATASFALGFGAVAAVGVAGSAVLAVGLPRTQDSGLGT